MRRVEILRKARKKLRKRESPGICEALRLALRDCGFIIMTYKDINKYFPLFTKESAKKFSNRLSSGLIWDIDFWWPMYSFGLFSGRRRFFRWLMRQYKNDKEEI